MIIAGVLNLLLRGLIKGKHYLVLRFHLMLSDWHHVFDTLFSVLCAHTDSSGWIAEERKSSTVTERSACSCFVPDWLLHSAQLTLQQGSAAGKMQHAYTISTGCHGQSGEKLHVPPTFLSSLSYIWKLIKCFRRVCFFPLHFSRIYADGDILNHSKNKTSQ